MVDSRVKSLGAALLFGLATSACLGHGGSSGGEADDDGLELEGVWGHGVCLLVNAGMNSSQRIVAFRDGEVSALRVLFEEPGCRSPIIRIFERIDGTYTEGRTAGSSVPTPIDIDPPGVGPTGPRAFDLYQIEDGELRFGDYATGDGSSELSRPTLTADTGLERIGDDTSAIF